MNIPDIKQLTPNQTRECQLRKNYAEFCNFIDTIEYFPEGISIQEKIWLYMNNLKDIPLCPVCGNKVKFKSLACGYKSACSKACSNKNPNKIQKTKDNNIEKYGVSSPVKTKEVQEKMKKTCLERYGVENSSQNKEIYNKIRNTCIERYGGLGNASKKIQEKQKQKMLDLYGVENAMQCEEIKNKLKETFLKLYGEDSPFKLQFIRDKAKKSMIERYGVEYPYQSEEIKEKIKKTNLERYGVEWYCQTKEYNSSLSNNSKPNKKFAELLERYNIKYEREFAIENRRYDFKVGNILIEINPLATHNSTWGIKNKEPLDKMYHTEKSRLAAKNGYLCIHIWDWDDYEMVAKSLVDKTVIYARNCTVKEISIKEANEFIDKYHFQGSCRGTKTAVALEYQNEIVGVMTFGKPRYNRKYEAELLRLCFKNDVKVVGGAAKLFSYYIEKYDPVSIISYCDKAKFSGEVYKSLGFNLLNSGAPALHWFNGRSHIRESMLLKLGFDKIFNTNYGKGTDNDELMLLHGFVEIYDCGQDTYSYHK